MIQTVCSEIGRKKVGISIQKGVLLWPGSKKILFGTIFLPFG
jgi:hypothetical protein